jgi:hypothetical protein
MTKSPTTIPKEAIAANIRYPSSNENRPTERVEESRSDLSITTRSLLNIATSNLSDSGSTALNVKSIVSDDGNCGILHRKLLFHGGVTMASAEIGGVLLKVGLSA